MSRKLELGNLPTAAAIRKQMAAFKRSRLAPIRQAIKSLEREQRAIERKLAALRALLGETKGVGAAPAGRGRKRRRHRATKAEMAKIEAAMLEKGQAVFERLSRRRGQRVATQEVKKLVGSGFLATAVVKLWNRRNPKKKIAAEGHGLGCKYYVR